MSSFTCPKCGTACLDTPYGYATGCRHHPADAKPTIRQLLIFVRDEFGLHTPEFGFLCRFELMSKGIGPPLLPEEDMLLVLLVEVWRDSLVR